MLTRTPPFLSAYIRQLAAAVRPGGVPVYVPVQPRAGGVLNECFANVAAAVNDHGGEAVQGWALWEWPGVMMEAEFHAVWRAPGGDLIDVSPRVDRERRILFLPDPAREFAGVRVNNVRRPLRDDARVRELIAVCDEIYRVLNAGERAHQFGLVSVPEHEIAPLLQRKAHLVAVLRRLSPARNEPCPCGSGRKYKRCCSAAPYAAAPEVR